MLDVATHRTSWRVEKYEDDITGFEGREEEFYAAHQPYEVIEGEGNLLANAGIALMLDLLMGAGGTVFSNANAHVGVGDGQTAAAASQTDLQGTNKTRKAMEASYPQRSSQTISFRSAFGSGDGNHAWNEWAVFNASSSGTMLNRKVQSFGTKSGGTWTITVSVTIT